MTSFTRDFIGASLATAVAMSILIFSFTYSNNVNWMMDNCTPDHVNQLMVCPEK